MHMVERLTDRIASLQRQVDSRGQGRRGDQSRIPHPRSAESSVARLRGADSCARQHDVCLNMPRISFTDQFVDHPLVDPSMQDVFDDEYWGGLDVVVNALDNVSARLYVDSRCVYFGRPLLESGTLGAKANTQVVVPDVTENYGACLLKHSIHSNVVAWSWPAMQVPGRATCSLATTVNQTPAPL